MAGAESLGPRASWTAAGVWATPMCCAEDATDFADRVGVFLDAVVRAHHLLGVDALEVRAGIGNNSVSGLVDRGGSQRADDRVEFGGRRVAAAAASSIAPSESASRSPGSRYCSGTA